MCAAHVYTHVVSSHPLVILTACKSIFIDTLCASLNVHTDQRPPRLHQGHSDSIHGDVELPQVGQTWRSSLLILPLH